MTYYLSLEIQVILRVGLAAQRCLQGPGSFHLLILSFLRVLAFSFSLGVT